MHALYRSVKKDRNGSKNEKKSSSNEDGGNLAKKPEVPRFTKQAFHISKPSVPLCPTFYEKLIKD